MMASFGFAEPGWFWLHPKPSGNGIRDIQLLDGKSVLAIEGPGAFLFSNDGGQAWERKVIPTLPQMGAIDYKGNVLLAAGFGGLIVKSLDAGKSWIRLDSGKAFNFTDIRIGEDGAVVAVGNGGIIANSQNSGATWSLANVNVKTQLFAVDISRKGVALAVGDKGHVLRSQDAGKNWKSSN